MPSARICLASSSSAWASDHPAPHSNGPGLRRAGRSTARAAANAWHPGSRWSLAATTRSLEPAPPGLRAASVAHTPGGSAQLVQPGLREGTVAAQFVHHRAADPRIGIGLEGRAAPGIELPSRFDQAQDAGRLQVLGVHARRQPREQPAVNLRTNSKWSRTRRSWSWRRAASS